MRFSKLLLAALSAPLACQATLFRPDNRFVVFSELCDDIREAVDTIGYNETEWNSFNEFNAQFELEGFDYFTILKNFSEVIDEIDFIMSGNDRDDFSTSWDCYINHYEFYDFDEMLDVDFLGDQQQHWVTLGWNESQWNEGAEPLPDSELLFFEELTPEEQAAAIAVCYTADTWNERSLEDFGDDPPGCGCSCFSGVDMVDVLGKGPVSMDSLQIGDYVLADNAEYSRVYSFSHLDHKMKNQFLQIHAEGIDSPLEISEKHMLYVNEKMRPASEVKKGDKLSGGMKVTDIKKIGRRGVYAPVTESGKIVVNGVLSSSYVSLLDHSSVNMHDATHAVFAPHRMVCAFNFGICEKETYTNGYSNWIYYAMHFINYINEFCAPFQATATVVASPVLGALLVVEQFVLSPLFITSMLTLAGFLYTKSKKASMI